MAIAQTPWVLPGNNTINPANDWLGSQNNADLILRTNAEKRFRLLPDATYAIGSFPGQVKDGSLLLSPDVDAFYTQGAPGPYSQLHLAAASNSAQSASYRDWMGTGLTLTGNRDHSYVGLKGKEEDYTDMVVHWSDNPGKQFRTQNEPLVAIRQHICRPKATLRSFFQQMLEVPAYSISFNS